MSESNGQKKIKIGEFHVAVYADGSLDVRNDLAIETSLHVLARLQAGLAEALIQREAEEAKSKIETAGASTLRALPGGP